MSRGSPHADLGSRRVTTFRETSSDHNGGGADVITSAESVSDSQARMSVKKWFILMPRLRQNRSGAESKRSVDGRSKMVPWAEAGGTTTSIHPRPAFYPEPERSVDGRSQITFGIRYRTIAKKSFPVREREPRSVAQLSRTEVQRR
jgi:hypothetical protein